MRIPRNMLVMRKPAGLAVEQVQTAAIRADPYIVMMILINTQHVVIAQTIRRSIMPEVYEFPVVPIDEIKTSRKGAYPHVLLRVAVNAIQRIGADARRIDIIMQIMMKDPRGIEDHQPVVLRSDPDIAFAVLAQGIDGIAAQARGIMSFLDRKSVV